MIGIVEGTVTETAENTVTRIATNTAIETVVSTMNGIKWMIIGIRFLNVRRTGEHEDTCDIKNDCPT
jgi:hypothetical protein